MSTSNSSAQKPPHNHAGHRDRMKGKILKDGFRTLYDHEVLEVLLFYAIPRRDTNQLAHELIERFGSLKELMEADVHQIAECSGMGESSAILIKTVMEFAIRYEQSSGEEVLYYDSITKVIRYLANYYYGITKEKTVVMLFDNKMKHIDTIDVGEGTVNTSSVSLRKIEEAAFRRDAAAVILAHNHPDGMVTPSIEDMNTTRFVYEHLKQVSLPLLEHIIVSGREAYPIMHYSGQYELGSAGSNGFDEEFFYQFFKPNKAEL